MNEFQLEWIENFMISKILIDFEYWNELENLWFLIWAWNFHFISFEKFQVGEGGYFWAEGWISISNWAEREESRNLQYFSFEKILVELVVGGWV